MRSAPGTWRRPVTIIAISALLFGAGCGSTGNAATELPVATIDGDTDAAGPSETVGPSSTVAPESAATEPEDQSDSRPEGPEPHDAATDNDEGGISAEEAEQTDALSADYDMLLTGPDKVEEIDGCVRFDVTASNVGGEPDNYRIESDVGQVDTGGESPTALRLAPGEEAVFVVELCDPTAESLTLQVFSEGRGGALVDQLSLG